MVLFFLFTFFLLIVALMLLTINVYYYFDVILDVTLVRKYNLDTLCSLRLSVYGIYYHHHSRIGALACSLTHGALAHEHLTV